MRNGGRGYPQSWSMTKRHRIWAFQIHSGRSSKFEQQIFSLKKSYDRLNRLKKYKQLMAWARPLKGSSEPSLLRNIRFSDLGISTPVIVRKCIFVCSWIIRNRKNNISDDLQPKTVLNSTEIQYEFRLRISFLTNNFTNDAIRGVQYPLRFARST